MGVLGHRKHTPCALPPKRRVYSTSYLVRKKVATQQLMSGDLVEFSLFGSIRGGVKEGGKEARVHGVHGRG